MLTTLVVMMLGAGPGGDAPERAAVLLSEAAAPDAKVIGALLKELGGEAPVATPDGAWAVPGLGRVTVTAAGAMDEGEARLAFKRGISAIISDTPLPAHAARWTIALTAEAAVTPVAALDALARLCSGLARAPAAVAVHFEAGRVLHPAGYVVSALRERLPAAWLWVGFELGGTKERLTLTSAGLAKAGLMELELASPRRHIGHAIEAFFDLVALALSRHSDFADGAEIARKDAPPLVVRVADGRWRVDFDRPGR